MTNKERYKKAFEPLHASRDLSVEVLEMKDNNKKKKYVLRPAAAIAAAAILICSSFGVCYAADVGGIRQTLRVWFEGKQVNFTAEKTEDGVEYVFDDDDKKVGISVVASGIDEETGEETEREISPQEVISALSVSVSQKYDGSVWLYYYDKSYDITRFLTNGTCQVSFIGQENQMIYFDIKGNGDGTYDYTCAYDTPEAGHSADEYTRLDQ